MATNQPPHELEWSPPEAGIETSPLEALESEFHNPKVGTLEDAGAKLLPDVIVIKIGA